MRTRTGFSPDSECTFRSGVKFRNERPVFSLVDSCEIFHVNVQMHTHRSGMVTGGKMCVSGIHHLHTHPACRNTHRHPPLTRIRFTANPLLSYARQSLFDGNPFGIGRMPAVCVSETEKIIRPTAGFRASVHGLCNLGQLLS